MSSMLTHVADHMVWSLPILLCEGLHDPCGAGDASNWEVLSGISESRICARLGMSLCSPLWVK